MDNLVEYADPEIYDLENQDYKQETAFLLERARLLGGEVLELGCGTGRITIPLAHSGVDITGLDVVPAMLARARQKAGDLPIRWELGDVRTFVLKRSFSLIFETGSVFHHLLTREDQEACLERIRWHLQAGGRYILSLMFPHADRLGDVSDEIEWFTYQDAAGREIQVSGTEAYDPLRQVKLETAYRRWEDAAGQPVVRAAPLSLRYLFPQEIEALLHYNGFEVLERFGDWDASLLTAKSPLMILVCGVR